MPITAEAVRLQASLDRQVDEILDDQTRILTAAWVRAWAEVAADLQDTLADLYAGGGRVTVTTVRRSLRLRQILAVINDQLQTLAETAGVTITGDVSAIVTDAAAVQAQILGAQVPTRSDLADELRKAEVAQTAALDAIVKRTTTQITSRTRLLSPSAYDAVRRELIRAVAVGSNPRTAAARMVARAEGGFNGGLARALTISRTELLDAHRTAAQVEQAQHADVLAGWVWLAHLDSKTCPACLAKQGILYDLDEAGPRGHQSCRCVRMPQVKSWAELGFDDAEPESVVVDGRTWFEQQTAEVQLELLGRRRLELLQSGAITWEQLATLRKTLGWRDSWGVTPLADLTQSRGRRAS